MSAKRLINIRVDLATNLDYHVTAGTKPKLTSHLPGVMIIMIMIMTSGWGLQQRPTSPITKNTVH